MPTKNLRLIRRWAHVFALLSFLLPFVQVSCGGTPIARLTGVSLALGTGSLNPSKVIPGPSQVTPPSQSVPRNGYVTISLLAAIVAAGAVFVSKGYVVAMFSGVVTAITLLCAYLNMPTNGMITIEVQIGFYLALLLSSVGAGIAVYLRMTKSLPQSGSLSAEQSLAKTG